MNISDDMRLAIERQLDAEADVELASSNLSEARRQVDLQAEKEGLFHRDIQAMVDYLKTKGTDELLRSV